MIDSSAPGGSPPVAPRIERTFIIAVLGLTLLAHVHFVLKQNVNWDEFYFLSFVYDYARGTLALPLQTFHVHIFGWLTRVDGQEVDQIIVARATYFVLLCGTFTCVYLLARRVASVNGALFAVLCCAAYSNILYHGTAFRTDGLSVLLLMVALVCVQCSAHRVLMLGASAVLIAVALLVTIKSLLFLPIFGLLLLSGRLGEWHSTRTRREILLFVCALVGTTLALYFWHRSTLVPAAVPDPATYLQSTAGTVIRRDVLFPGFFYFVPSVFGNLVQWTFLGYAFVTLGRKLMRRQQMLETSSRLVLALPLLSLLFYRNAFPYFYVLIMPPALVLCAFAFDELTRNSRLVGRRGVPATLVATFLIAGLVASSVSTRLSDGTTAQREVIRAVHDMFPQPVPYIDRNGMIASFPKVGFFMSTWGIERYREVGRPVFADLLRAHGPKFLLANSPALSSVFEEPIPAREGSEQLLLAEDVAVLRQHFVPYWGPVHVAGTAMHLPQGVDTVWEVLVEGPYRLLSDGPVVIGDSLYPPGSTVELKAGFVSLRSDVTQRVVLHTSIAQGIPTAPPPGEPIYTGF